MEKEQIIQLEGVNQINLVDTEREEMQKTFAFMQEREAGLANVDTQNKESVVYVMPIYNVLREDTREQVVSREDLLKSAPQATEDSWQVPRLVK